MSSYKKLVESALKRVAKGKLINENLLYPEGLEERMHPKLEEDLVYDKHSLGKHPIFPEGDEYNFLQTIMGERFSEVAKRCKRAFGTDVVDGKEMENVIMPLVKETMKIESKNRAALEELAIKTIREEFDIPEDMVEIKAELVSTVSRDGTKENKSPVQLQTEFENHDEMVNANKEVYKRRFLNAMIQGAAKKCNHMFHMVDDDISEIDPRLSSKYAKTMAAADYIYYTIPKIEKTTTGGIVKVTLPSSENEKPVIEAKALIFPVLIHELVKGVMELLSANGLPENKKIGDFVVAKADFLAAEPWDMRIGPALWSRFTNLIEPDDFKLKHYVYADLAKMPVDEFNTKMREVMAGTKEGKRIISDLIKEIKSDLQEEEYEKRMEEIRNNPDKTYSFEEFMRGINEDDWQG
jgi:hypothetical protein